MTIRDVLIHLDETPRSAVRLRLASELAQRLGAQLLGLYVMKARAASLDERRSAAFAEEEFRGRLDQLGLEGGWRLAEGSAADALIRFGSCADLSVIGQPLPGGQRGGLSEREFVKILHRIGGPVLAVPYTGSFPSVGERALVHWDCSPQAVRAVNEALPLLCGADAVQVLLRDSRDRRNFDVGIAGKGILDHLARHGISAKAARLLIDRETEMGEELLSCAADFRADLMVVGASPGSQLRNLMRRTMTHTLIGAMTTPLLLAS